MIIIDLTGHISEKSWYYGQPFSPFSRKKISDLSTHGYIAFEYRIFSHMGTHLDSLAHFEYNASDIDQISLETLIGSAIVIPINNCKPFKEIVLSDISEYSNKVKANDIVLFYTGWDKMWESSDYALQTPYLSNELALWLVNNKVKLVGTDTALCCDPRQGLKFVVKDANIPDNILLKNGIPYINGLVNLASLRGKRIQFFALPLKIKHAEGTPIRAIAICND